MALQLARGGRVCPRERAVDPYRDVSSVRSMAAGEHVGEWVADPSFPEVPRELLQEGEWDEICAGPGETASRQHMARAARFS